MRTGGRRRPGLRLREALHPSLLPARQLCDVDRLRQPLADDFYHSPPKRSRCLTNAPWRTRPWFFFSTRLTRTIFWYRGTQRAGARLEMLRLRHHVCEEPLSHQIPSRQHRNRSSVSFGSENAEVEHRFRDPFIILSLPSPMHAARSTARQLRNGKWVCGAPLPLAWAALGP